jgi:hypothetical protein
MQEGAGHASISGYVEVVFDNSDGRFPVRALLASLTFHSNQQRIHAWFNDIIPHANSSQASQAASRVTARHPNAAKQATSPAHSCLLAS